MPESAKVEDAYRLARERYAEIGVDTEAAMETLVGVQVSLHCWQGDDVGGFESSEELGGGLAVTGNHPGRARDADELRSDYAKALSLIPGRHRVNIHAIYAETGGKRVERTDLSPEHFSRWIDWAKDLGLGMDFNPTFFSHPKAASGFTLASRDEGVRRYWVEHGIACRRIGAAMGKILGSPCVTNVWIPDGYKDTPVDRKTPRMILRKSLDEIFAEPADPKHNLDAVESKLFGIGSESYVVGSHEFYLGYAVERAARRHIRGAPERPGVLLCLDAGHFHPTETISDKISSVLTFVDRLLLHVSRGVRWDSDHVVIVTDELRAISEELVRGGYLDRVHVALDFFDASINRVAAWVIGTRAMIRSLLLALLQPVDELRELEATGDFTSRLARLEELKATPAGAVWDKYCLESQVPVGEAWLGEVKVYERDVLSKR